LLRLFQQIDKLPFHLFIDLAVTGECFRIFFVARERTDEVGVFDLLVEVADKRAPREVRRGYLGKPVEVAPRKTE
jgi:hypothetical protein